MDTTTPRLLSFGRDARQPEEVQRRQQPGRSFGVGRRIHRLRHEVRLERRQILNYPLILTKYF